MDLRRRTDWDQSLFVPIKFPFITEMAAVILRHKSAKAGAQPSILASRHVDRLQKLDAKDLIADYEVEMLMLDG